MTVWAIGIALSAVIVGCIPFGTVVWRKREAQLREEDEKWRDTQLARLQSLRDRMKDQPVPLGYPDLPSVRLAGLLAAPRDEPSEPMVKTQQTVIEKQKAPPSPESETSFEGILPMLALHNVGLNKHPIPPNQPKRAH
jgi:hypothetical protein